MATAEHSHADHGHDHGHDDGMVHAHIASPMFYYAVFAALITLTFITVGVSYFDFGSANTIIALIVATMKASLVAAFFMHLTHDKLFNTICLLAAFLFLGIFFLLTYEDTNVRGHIDAANGTEVLSSSGETAPGGMPLEVKKPHEAAKAGEHGATEKGGDKPGEGHATPKGAGSVEGGGATGGGGTPHH